MNEWEFAGQIGRGSSGPRARLVQEWLCLHDVQVAVDGKYGPATAEGVRRFQTLQGLRPTGRVNRDTFEALLGPLNTARSDLSVSGHSLGQLIVAYAEQHLGQHPREIGGQNMGPWVRLYMRGLEGSEWPWCAGFACFILAQASRSLSVSTPLHLSFSCDLLATDAMRRETFLPETRVGSPSDIPPGSLFLLRRIAGDWIHTGLVVSADQETFETIEGNTNDAGDREGYEVCRRLRGYKNKDFIVMT